METTQGLERRMRVEIPEERVRGEIDKRLGDLARSIRIPGFRPGKAPVKVVAPALRTAGARRSGRRDPAGIARRRARAGAASPGRGAAHRAAGDYRRGELHGDVRRAARHPLPQFESMEIARPAATVTDEDVGRMLENMRVQRRTWNAVERAATSSDRVVVDLEGLVDGEPLDEARAKELPVELDAGRIVDGFEDGLVGVQAGEDRTLELAFPENYPEHLAGKR